MNNLPELTKMYLHDCEYRKKLNHKTVKAYRIDLQQFHLFCISRTDPFSKQAITDYIESLHVQYKPRTAKRKIACLRAFVNYLVFEELIEGNPLDKVQMHFKEALVLPRALPLKAIQKLLYTAHKASNFQKTESAYRNVVRDVAVLELLFASGLRVSELCSIQKEDIDLREGYVRVNGKGARERYVYISNAEVLSALRQYKKLFQKSIEEIGWFFVNRLGNRLGEQSVRTLIHNYAYLAKLNNHVTPHMIRHSFATLMLEEDVDIRYIQSILGHSSITTTQIYTHVSTSKQRKIMSRKHPRNRLQM